MLVHVEAATLLPLQGHRFTCCELIKHNDSSSNIMNYTQHQIFKR